MLLAPSDLRDCSCIFLISLSCLFSLDFSVKSVSPLPVCFDRSQTAHRAKQVWNEKRRGNERVEDGKEEKDYEGWRGREQGRRWLKITSSEGDDSGWWGSASQANDLSVTPNTDRAWFTSKPFRAVTVNSEFHLTDHTELTIQYTHHIFIVHQGL